MSDGNTNVSCGQRCPDCGEVVHVKGTWADWDRIHGAVCTRGQMSLPLNDAPQPPTPGLGLTSSGDHTK